MLYSSSINGAIYEWSIEKRNRIADIVIQDVTVKGLVEVSDSKIICIGSDGTLKEIKDSKVNKIFVECRQYKFSIYKECRS